MFKCNAWQQAQPERKLLVWMVAVSALALAGVSAGLLFTAWKYQREQVRQWESGTARCLAGHLARALEEQDDLLALSLLREALGHYPQLREGQVFDRQGNILWHTDASQIGKKCLVQWQSEGRNGWFAGRTPGGRPGASVQVPLTGDGKIRLQLVWDETSRIQASYFLGLQTLILLVLAAGAIACLSHRYFKSYAIFDRWAKIPGQARDAPDPESFSPPRPGDERGQAVLELTLALGLFACLLTAIAQFSLLGFAHIQCQVAARRAAWLWNVWNAAGLEKNFAEIRRLAPGCRVERADTAGSRMSGMAFRIVKPVRAVGWFRMLRPAGFTVSARSAVIAYNPKPVVSRIIREGWPFAMEHVLRSGTGRDDASGP